jgi:small-conductance mechanosensitive channel
MDSDLAVGGPAELDQTARNAVEEIRTLVHDHAHQHSLSLVVRATIQVALATALFVAFWTGVLWLRSRLVRRLEGRTRELGHVFQRFGYDWRPALLGAAMVLTRLLALGIILAGAYGWLAFVLGRFPYTHRWADQLGAHLTTAVGALAAGAVHEIPNLIALLVVFVLTRGVIRLLNGWFAAVEAGRYLSDWLDPEAARATRRLANIGVWVVALIVAFPYLPGSHSEAFRGICVFLGLMVSLGGASFVGQLIGGLAAVYSRSVRTGDFIRVGKVEGVVKELGMLSTRLVTPMREEVTVPNSLLISSEIHNLSRLRGNATLITTAVTIGYDAPWRQVEAMLLRAAERTEHLAHDPAPRVLQTALEDFYVRYQLNCCAETAHSRIEVLARLHANIQDVFNENGVQIMSPNFRAQPDQPVLVPKERWEPPLVPPASEGPANRR